MANLIVFMRTNMEKGNKWMDADGNLCDMEKVEKTAKKEFMSALKNDTVKGNVNLNQFTKDFLKENYTDVSELLSLVTHPKESEDCEQPVPNN
jgi:hypothetical protein